MSSDMILPRSNTECLGCFRRKVLAVLSLWLDLSTYSLLSPYTHYTLKMVLNRKAFHFIKRSILSNTLSMCWHLDFVYTQKPV